MLYFFFSLFYGFLGLQKKLKSESQAKPIMQHKEYSKEMLSGLFRSLAFGHVGLLGLMASPRACWPVLRPDGLSSGLLPCPQACVALSSSLLASPWACWPLIGPVGLSLSLLASPRARWAFKPIGLLGQLGLLAS